MVCHSRSDPNQHSWYATVRHPTDREFLPLLECSALNPGSMGKPLGIQLNQTYSNPPELDFFIRGLSGGIYTRICRILVTF